LTKTSCVPQFTGWSTQQKIQTLNALSDLLVSCNATIGWLPACPWKRQNLNALKQTIFQFPNFPETEVSVDLDMMQTWGTTLHDLE